MNEPSSGMCLHCELAPQQHYLRLCTQCAARKSIRRLYRRNYRWNADWDAHLQRLVERARVKLPLFPSHDELAKERCHEKIDKVRSA